MILHASPIVIDDFSTGTGSTTSTTTQDGGAILGGERDIVFGPTGATVTVGGGSLSISSVTTPGTISLTYDGNDDTAAGNGLGLGGVDLTMGATNTLFELVVSQVTSSALIGLTAFETATDTSGFVDSITSPGLYTYSFAP